MSVDWSQFRDGDRVRVTFEGTWDEGDLLRFDEGRDAALYQHGHLAHATSAELIARPFTPPAAGKLFRNEALWISQGKQGFRLVRFADGGVPKGATAHDLSRPWSAMTPEWLADIEVIDGV